MSTRNNEQFDEKTQANNAMSKHTKLEKVGQKYCVDHIGTHVAQPVGLVDDHRPPGHLRQLLVVPDQVVVGRDQDVKLQQPVL
jgi:hypothetical protein